MDVTRGRWYRSNDTFHSYLYATSNATSKVTLSEKGVSLAGGLKGRGKGGLT